MTFEYAFLALHLTAIFFLCLQTVYAISYNYQEDHLGHFSMALLFNINHLVNLSRISQLFLVLLCHLSSIPISLAFQLIQFPKIPVAIHQYMKSHYLAWNAYSCSSLTLLLQLICSCFQYMPILILSFLQLVLQVYQDILLMINVSSA